MIVYLLLLLIVSYGSIHYDYYGRTLHKREFYIFEWIVVVLVVGLRYKVGGDSISYEDSFYSYPTLQNINSFDFAGSRYGYFWNLFVILCKSISGDFFVLQLIQSIIVNAAFFYFFKRQTNNYFSAVLVYCVSLCVFVYCTEIMRASLAVSIFLFSYKYLIRKKYIIYFLLCILAIGFHDEAYIMLLFPFVQLLKKLKATTWTILLVFIISFIIVSSFNYSSFISEVIFSQSVNVQDSIASYNGRIHYETVTVKLMILTIIQLLPFILLLWFRKGKNDFSYALLLLFIFLRIQSLMYGSLASRLTDFIIPFVITTFVSTKGILKDRIQRSLFGAYSIYFVLCLVYYYIYLIPLIYPYSSILDPQEYAYRNVLYEDIVSGAMSREDVLYYIFK